MGGPMMWRGRELEDRVVLGAGLVGGRSQWSGGGGALMGHVVLGAGLWLCWGRGLDGWGQWC